MPPKIRELLRELQKNGFVDRGGKGSHRNFSHPLCSKVVTISGHSSEDAKKYQEKQVKDAINEVKSK